MKATTKYYPSVKEEYATRLISYTIQPYIQRINEIMEQTKIEDTINVIIGSADGVIRWQARPSNNFKGYFRKKDFDTGIFRVIDGYNFPLLAGESKGYSDKTMVDGIQATVADLRVTYGEECPLFTYAEDEARGEDVVIHNDLPNVHILTGGKRPPSDSKKRNGIDPVANSAFIDFITNASIKAIQRLEKSILNKK